jgi:hypothetical protein
MSLAFERSPDAERDVTVVRAGVLAREVCRRGGRGEVAAVFERSLYVRIGDDFICIGEPAIGNGPTTLIIAARMAELALQRGQRASVGNGRIAVGDVLLDLSNCATWRAPPWPRACANLPVICATIAQRAAAESPADSLARAVFGADATPLARLARPRVAKFASWLSVGWAKAAEAFGEGGRAHHPSSRTIVGGHGVASLRLSPPYGPLSRGMTRGELPARPVRDLVGLGPGLTPSGDDFLIGALAMLDALEQTNMHAALGRAVVAAADRTSPLSASFLRAASAGHVGENLHTMVAAILTGDADASVTAAARIGHTSGWDALAGAVVTLYRC